MSLAQPRAEPKSTCFEMLETILQENFDVFCYVSIVVTYLVIKMA